MIGLADIYETIATDLKESERIFAEELVSDQGFISDLCHHVAQFHGKRVRPALLLLSAQACGGVTHEHRVLAAVIEMVHIATLVHDDILDEADIRRRAATVNRLWGNERAVLMGDFLISHAFHLCSSLDSQFASRTIADVTNKVCEGEMMQVANRYNYELTRDEYFDIITRKTASLIGVCGQLGAAFAGADRDAQFALKRFGVAMGVAFQITDDVLDLTGDEAEVGKSLGRDLDEGKLTLPVIHALRESAPEERDALIALLQSSHAQRDVQVGRLLQRTGAAEHALQTAGAYLDEAREALDALRASSARDALHTMTDFVLSRRV